MRILLFIIIIMSGIKGQQGFNLTALPIDLQINVLYYVPYYIVTQSYPKTVIEKGETKAISAETVALRMLIECKCMSKLWHEIMCKFFPEKDNGSKIVFQQLEEAYTYPEQPINFYTALYYALRDGIGMSPKMIVALGIKDLKENKIVLGVSEDDEAFSFKKFLNNCLDWSIAARKHDLITHFVNGTQYPSIVTMLQRPETFRRPPLIHAIKLKDDVTVKILLDAGANVYCRWKTGFPKDGNNQKCFAGYYTPLSIASAQKDNEEIIKLLQESEERIKKIKIDTDASD